jgi:hypothetical protein
MIEWRNKVLRDERFIVSSPEVMMQVAQIGQYHPDYCAEHRALNSSVWQPTTPIK